VIDKKRTAVRHMDLVYDVGLHKGQDTAYYLKNGFRVIAFEADPDLIRMNEARFFKPLKEKQLIIVQGAIVSDLSVREVVFYKNLKKSDWSTINPHRMKINERLGTTHREIEVPVVDFASCIEEYGMPYYMKIDIESADRICLDIVNEFDIKPCNLSVEAEKVDFEKLVEDLNLLSGMGYTEFAPVQQAAFYKFRSSVQSKEGNKIHFRFSHGSSGPFGRDIRNWMSREDVQREYEIIFKRYQKYGDDTIWGRNQIAKAALYAFFILCAKPVPGWYDTHARLSECE